MNCPQCEHGKFEVLETRTSGDGIRRRRSCVACGHRFTTFERIDRRMPLVIKKNGQREPFSRDKIREGLQIACRKRPVSAVQLEEAGRRIEDQAIGIGRNEIPSDEVGKLVLSELKGIDLVGYLRFASVYQEIQSADDFLELLRPWVDPKTGKTKTDVP
jgi:transcriptional repressor NrdR